MSTPKALAPGQAAKYLGVSRSCLARWCRAGLLEKYRDLAGEPRYLLADLNRILLTNRPKRGRKFTSPPSEHV